MKEIKIFKSLCRPQWYAKAYAEYTKDVANTFGYLIAFFQECINSDIDDQLSDTDSDANEALISEAVSRAYSVTVTGLNPVPFYVSSKVPISDKGYCRVWDLGLGVVKYSLGLNDVGHENEILVSNGTYLPYEDFAAYFLDTLINTQFLQLSFETFSELPTAQLTERLNLFINKCSGLVNVQSDTRASIFNYYKDLISALPDVSTFTSRILDLTGISATAAQESSSTSSLGYINAEITKFTGCTPGVALDFGSVKSAATSVVNVGAKVVQGIWSSLNKLGAWLFSKADRLITNTIIDPSVAEALDSKNNFGLMDGFAWAGGLDIREDDIPSYLRDFPLSPEGLNVIGILNTYEGSWIKLETVLGELLFKPVRMVDEPIPFSRVNVYWKPSAIDVSNLVQSSGLDSISIPAWDESKTLFQNVQNVADITSQILNSVQAVEKDVDKYTLARGFAASDQLLPLITDALAIETAFALNPNVSMDANNFTVLYNYQPPAITNNIVMGDITNKTILQLCMGMVNDLNYTVRYSANGIGLIASTNYDNMANSLKRLILLWAFSRLQRAIQPLDYVFVPYSSNTDSFSTPSWRLRSDAEIADIRDSFIEGAIVVAIVAVIAIGAGVAISKIRRNIFFKRKTFLDQMEAKSWAGESLTDSERRRYVRYSRKQALSNLLDPNAMVDNVANEIVPFNYTQDLSNVYNDTQDCKSQLSDVIGLIKS